MNIVLAKLFVRCASLLFMVASVWFGVVYFRGMAETPWSIVIAIGMFVVSMNVFAATLDDNAKREKVKKLFYVALVALLVFLNVFRGMFWT